MTNKKFFLAVLVMVFGITAIAFGQDRALNGTWVPQNAHELADVFAMEQRFNNGNVELFQDGVRIMQGTYTTANNKITMNTTHIGGGFYSVFGLERLTPRNEAFDILVRTFTTQFRYPRDMAIEMANEFLGGETEAADYSVRGNTLTITSVDEDGEITTTTFTRR